MADDNELTPSSFFDPASDSKKWTMVRFIGFGEAAFKDGSHAFFIGVDATDSDNKEGRVNIKVERNIIPDASPLENMRSIAQGLGLDPGKLFMEYDGTGDQTRIILIGEGGFTVKTWEFKSDGSFDSKVKAQGAVIETVLSHFNSVSKRVAPIAGDTFFDGTDLIEKLGECVAVSENAMRNGEITQLQLATIRARVEAIKVLLELDSEPPLDFIAELLKSLADYAPIATLILQAIAMIAIY